MDKISTKSLRHSINFNMNHTVFTVKNDKKILCVIVMVTDVYLTKYLFSYLFYFLYDFNYFEINIYVNKVLHILSHWFERQILV